MHKDLLIELGLSQNEAIVYEHLLINGKSLAGDIIKKTPLKRGVIYNALSDLVKKGLIKQGKTNKILSFSPNHPDKLREYIENREREVKKAEISLDSQMPMLLSSFNLVSNQPGVRIYEGKDGLAKTLNDSLSSKTEIVTYADIYGMEKYMGRANDKYITKRKELKIYKRAILADTPYARDYMKDYDKEVTELRYIDGKEYPMYLEMEIYDNKVSFMTFSDKKLIGVIIENEEIYKTQKSIFEIVWKNAKE
ncbi:MAG: helix-turn-helix domain-containing protein [Patescibacteria group bacterium]|nr:helix-turn-helix domain-containing protein [Patescibacteria group bacterium]MDD4304160.1 helix-turn-helix domain-containing protein [Patescibacteria group bacterium]MDD4695191.1 helix-turn-helix domain-containing protein [Patescibacteria group bacterium]